LLLHEIIWTGNLATFANCRPVFDKAIDSTL